MKVDIPYTPEDCASLPNKVTPPALKIEGININATPTNNMAIGAPTGTCVGLSLCCLNLSMAAIANPIPTTNEIAVAAFAIPERLDVKLLATQPADPSNTGVVLLAGNAYVANIAAIRPA